MLSAKVLLPVLLGVVLFFTNFLALFHAWLRPPQGFVPLWIVRSEGTAVQIAWFEGFKQQILLPSYQAPWLTEPAFFTPLKFVVGRLAGVFAIPAQFSYLVLTAAAYIFTSFCFFFALRTFTDSRRQAICAFLLAICSLPLSTLKALARAASTPVHGLPGLHDFVFVTGDGFFHGVIGSLSSTFGTGITLLAFSYIALYLNTEDRKFLRRAAVCAFFSGLIHPFEVFVITGGGALSFLIYRGLNWKQFLREALILCGSGALGVGIYVYQALSVKWLGAQAEITKWDPGSLLYVLKMLGIPLVAALALGLLQPRAGTPRTLILRCWIIAVLIGIYVPFFTWTQHFLDGILYAGAMLLVREAARFVPYRRIYAAYPRYVAAALALWCLMALIPHTLYRVAAFEDGARANPKALPMALQPADEFAVLNWLRKNGNPKQLVLAPVQHAGWLSTAPMHSFASHPHLGITYKTQAELSRRFYAGEIAPAAAEDFLCHFGVRYVVIPDGSRALAYTRDAKLRARLGSMQVFEFPENNMRAFGGIEYEQKQSLALLDLAVVAENATSHGNGN